MQNNEKKVVELNISDVLPNRFQPRIKFDENSINELALSIKKYGVIQPIVVRKIGDKYEIIAGERRYKASVLAGKTTIPAIISEMNDKDSVEIALIENVQREDLTPIEKAISYKKILDMGYISQEELANKVGKSQSSIANTLRLLNLTDDVQEALLENKISERHARSLLKLKDNKQQVDMLNKIVNERLTVRKTDEEIDRMLNDNMNNNFNNISTNDNSLETENVITIPDVEIPQVASPSLAPGFMDIDKIEQEAKDIAPIEKEKPNIDNLLQSDPNFVASEPVQPVPDDDPILTSGKFFNFFGNNTEENKDNFDTQQSFFSNTDNSMNNQVEGLVSPSVPTSSIETPAMSTPEVPTMPEVQPAYEVPVMDTPEVPTMPEVQPTYEVPVVDTPEVPAMPEVQPTYEVPVMDTPEVPTMPEAQPTYEVPVVDTPEVPAMPEVQPTYEVPVMDTPEVPTMPEAQPTYEVPVVDTPEVPAMPEVQPTYEVPVMDTPEVPAMPEVQPAYEVPVMDTPEVPTMPEVQPTYEVPVVDTPEVPAMPEVQPTYEVPVVDTVDIPSISDNQTETKNVGNTVIATSPNIKLALNTIRECENTLEKYGFNIDVEEIDFEDSYQVIIKIEK